MDLEELRKTVKSNNYRITFHALKEKEADNISLDEIIYSFDRAEVIEDYPSSKPFPCCLVLGFNNKGEPIHTVWAYDEHIQMAILITVYRPNPEKWVEYKERK